MVLYSHNAASVPECEELLDQVRLFESRATELGMMMEHRESIEEWRYYFSAYRDYLSQNDKHRSFEQFLDEHPRL